MTTREHLIDRAFYWVTDPRGGGAVPARFIGGYRCADGHEMKPYFRTVDGEVPLSEVEVSGVSAIGGRLAPPVPMILSTRGVGNNGDSGESA